MQLRITCRNWITEDVRTFDADSCVHEITPSGHLVVRAKHGGHVLYSAAPGMWHEAVVLSDEQTAEVAAGMAWRRIGGKDFK